MSFQFHMLTLRICSLYLSLYTYIHSFHCLLNAFTTWKIYGFHDLSPLFYFKNTYTHFTTNFWLWNVSWYQCPHFSFLLHVSNNFLFGQVYWDNCWKFFYTPFPIPSLTSRTIELVMVRGHQPGHLFCDANITQSKLQRSTIWRHGHWKHIKFSKGKYSVVLASEEMIVHAILATEARVVLFNYNESWAWRMR